MNDRGNGRRPRLMGNRVLALLAASVLLGAVALQRLVSPRANGGGDAPVIAPPAASIAEPEEGVPDPRWSAPRRAPDSSAVHAPERRPIEIGKGPGELLSGAVRTKNGAPIPGAEVELFERVGEAVWFGTLPHEWSDLEGTVTMIGSSHEGTAWFTRSDPRGGFRIQGRTTLERLQLGVGKSGYQTRWMNVLPGQTKVEVVLEPVAVSGRVLLAENVSPSGFRLEARRAGSSEQEKRVRSERLAEDASFEIPDLEPGLYELWFYHQFMTGCLRTVGPIAVPVEDDAAPLVVDLRHLVRHLNLAIFGSDGAPASGGTVHYRESGRPESSGSSAPIGRRGLAAIDTPWPVIDIRVVVPKYRSQVVEGVCTDLRVDLLPVGGVTLELDPQCLLRRAELILYLKQSGVGSTRLAFRPGSIDRIRRLSLTTSGRWNLEWWVIGDPRTEDGVTRYGLSELIPSSNPPVEGRDFIELEDTELAQWFVVAPDAARQAAIEAKLP